MTILALTPLLFGAIGAPAPLATALAPAGLARLADLPDSDADGLPDEWEAGRYDGIDFAAMGCSPRKKDLIIRFIPQSDVNLTTLQTVGDKVKAFYAALPVTNLNGTRGINVVIETGDKLPASDLSKPYTELYSHLPVNRRGIVHAFIVGGGTGGGGQTSGKDWSGVGTNWPTIVHELGHQLGLSHEGESFTRMSPIHGSLMNYDYSYRFKDDPEAIRYSTGDLASLVLNEERLNERLPFPLAKVEFLKFGPYRYKLEAKSSSETWIDWNRNGILGETRVRADINYGYASWLGGNTDTGMVAHSSPVLANHGGKLYVAAARLGGNTTDFVDDARTGTVFLTFRNDDGTWARPRGILMAANGDPAMASFRGMLFLSARQSNKVAIQAFQDNGRILSLKGNLNLESTDAEPWLVVDSTRPNPRLFLFLWFRSSKEVAYRLLNVRSIAGSNGNVELVAGPLKYVSQGRHLSSRLTSQWPISVVAQPVLDFRLDLTDRGEPAPRPPLPNELILMATKNEGSARNIGFRAKLVADAADGWTTDSTTPFPSGIAIQSSRRVSAVPYLLDSGNLYFFHVTMNDAAAGRAARLNCLQQVKDLTFNGGYLAKRLLNEWENTANAPHAIAFGSEIVHAYRRADAVTKIFVSLKGSGVETERMGDTNEIDTLANGAEPKGLQGSLRSLRAYFGKPR